MIVCCRNSLFVLFSNELLLLVPVAVAWGFPACSSFNCVTALLSTLRLISGKPGLVWYLATTSQGFNLSLTTSCAAHNRCFALSGSRQSVYLPFLFGVVVGAAVVFVFYFVVPVFAFVVDTVGVTDDFGGHLFWKPALGRKNPVNNPCCLWLSCCPLVFGSTLNAGSTGGFFFTMTDLFGYSYVFVSYSYSFNKRYSISNNEKRVSYS